jgi:Abnormal spindle-like microcephaly-assoc'd, ASPM-SPD-2-Hydin
VTIGSPNSQTIQISNSGTAVLTVTQVSVSGSGFLTSSLALPLSINPGAASTFNVQFGPQSAGSVTGSVSLVSNAPNSPSTVSLSGTGIASVATISLSATSLNFGSVTTGTSAQQSVTITNTGNADVTISQINIGGTGYTLTGGGSPVTLTPNQTMTITVHFSPTSAGTDSGSVSIVSNAVGSPLTIPLSGIATAPVTHSVALNWTASTSTVSGYNVYRSTTSGSGYTKVNPSLVGGVSYSDTSVANGTTYYYVTTAVDGSGNESSYSNEAQAIIP